MRILRIVVGICLILAVAWAVLLRARRGTESMAALRKFRYAHRGLYDKEAGIPENSLPAFSRAIARGFGAELDVHLLRDGTLAVFHDSDVKRMTGREGYLEDLSADELKDYALDGTKETIPQFKDVLALFAGTGQVLRGVVRPAVRGVAEKAPARGHPRAVELRLFERPRQFEPADGVCDDESAGQHHGAAGFCRLQI